MTEPASQSLVTVRNLTVAFTGGDRTVHAVNGVDFDLAPGEVLGVIGESGSGKSVTLRALLGILPPKRTKIGGTVRVDARDVLALAGRELEDYRGGVVSMIFQEPMLAFDPVFSIGDQIAESVIRYRAMIAWPSPARPSCFWPMSPPRRRMPPCRSRSCCSCASCSASSACR